ncbi:hypothetical protein ACQ9BO_19280 [Flavobacterium sp. P21]|uniref:hypothetical protein n=1 Tax=Flavobacterium sp. P21 TaxID=3423948 RepID=UPI003D673BBC
MKKIICMLLLIQGGYMMAQTETVVTPNGKKVQVDATPTTADNGLTKTGGNIQLGGALLHASTIVATPTNTLAIKGLEAGASTDKILVADASGVLKLIDGSGIGAGDNLGNHTATEDLKMSGFNIVGAR